MCLYISKTKGIILEKDLICYKQLEKLKDGTWKTPSRSWTIPKLDSIISPDEDAPEISICRDKYLLGGGVIHAYLRLPRNTEDKLFYKALIPKGTELWIQDDLSEIASRKMYITSEEVNEILPPDISPLSHLGADLRLASGERVPLSSDINLSDVVGIYSGDRVLSKELEIDKYGVQFSKNPLDGIPMRPFEWLALKDMNGIRNCEYFLPKDLDLPVLEEVKKKGGYLPALGELKEAFKNLLEVNISRVTLGLSPISLYDQFWTSTLQQPKFAWTCTGMGVIMETRLKYHHLIIPFLK